SKYIVVFFQAEDGIRDFHVTGVQTCALPISGRFDRGVLVCGTGIGMAIAANKVAGVRAAPVGDERSAALSREHNDANVLALGARVTSAELAIRLLDLFLDTPFAGGRHQRRLDKIALLDQGSR